ncbi:hypothetical protein FJ417_24605 [Mesorhizobium sp. B3-1-7]|uniref:hypothetical protein n=1 Tax=Mesorhizobium sp. B3-1-7 TaxID=2589894 RepID=UPI00112932E5|nr:hypothetical protein [Mesorhizobium sp. B3-1-7]TPI54735.1 hypothetical protein FJ417_24605 [Mesorhizobium sp. B3-1-7]
MDDEAAAAAASALEMIEASLGKLLAALGPEAAARVATGILQPDVLASAEPPEYWAGRFAARGLRMSARSLRAKALKAGLCYHVDKKVLISPRQIDELFRWRGSSKQRDHPTAPVSPSGAYKRALAKLKAAEDQRRRKPGSKG